MINLMLLVGNYVYKLILVLFKGSNVVFLDILFLFQENYEYLKMIFKNYSDWF